MISVIADTNIFLRYLTNDIPKQVDLVEKRLKEAERGKLYIRILHATVVEILYQLEKRYKFSKVEAVDKITTAFSVNWLHLDDKRVVFDALSLYKEVNIDFVDLLIWNVAKSQDNMVLTFDKDFDKLTPKIRLGP